MHSGLLKCGMCAILALQAAALFAGTSTSFLSMQTTQNPLNRDYSIRPRNPLRQGESDQVGTLHFLLTSSFFPQTPGTGKVWVTPISSPSDTFVLISGLDAPTGICFDKNNHFLYVVDNGLGDAPGQILQFEVDTDLKTRFELKTDIAAVMYDGGKPYDCWVCAYGNMFFTDLQTVEINRMMYPDLWSGFANTELHLYARADGHPEVDSPIAIEVENSTAVYFLNQNTLNAPLLSHGPANPLTPETRVITPDINLLLKPWGIALDTEYVYMATDDGRIWLYDRKDPNMLIKAEGLQKPRGLCVANDDLFVVDSGIGEVFHLSSGGHRDRSLKGVVKIPGAYELLCVRD